MACADCFKGSLHEGTPKGKLEIIHGFTTYVASAPPATTTTTTTTTSASKKSTIIFFTDAFGLNLINNKILADHYALETQCRVLVPDIIPGGPAPLSMMHAFNAVFKPVDSWLGYLNPLTYLRKGWALIVMLTTGIPFAVRANAKKAYPQCLQYVRDERAAMPVEGKIGVAGFCWGGYHSTRLCMESSVPEGGASAGTSTMTTTTTVTTTSKPLVDAQFNAHPSFVKPKDIVEAVEKFKVPYSSAVAEVDTAFDRAAAEETEAALRRKIGDGDGVYEFKVWKGCHHGFSTRASFDEGSVMKDGYEGAAKQAVDWFNKFLI